MKQNCRIAILEHYALFSSGIKMLLNTFKNMEVIAVGVSPQQLFLHLHDQNPDIILINLLHCNNSGIKTIKQTKKLFPHIPLLIITSRDYSECFTDYIRYGVKGFVFSEDSPEVLTEILNSLCEGKNKIAPESQSEKNVIAADHILSDREMDVLKLFCNGLTYKEIGEKLFISPRTVETHKKNILAKLKISSTAEMVKYATRRRLFPD